MNCQVSLPTSLGEGTLGLAAVSSLNHSQIKVDRMLETNYSDVVKLTFA